MAVAARPRGIDVSNHQGIVDWRAVANAGYLFGFSKATEGHYFNDRYFARNWQESRAAGLYRGAYHFARPSTALPEQEAEFFLASLHHAGGVEPTDMVVVDIEDTNYHSGGAYGSVGNWALGFCGYIEGALGFKPIVYTASWYATPRNIHQTPDLADYALWIASYQQEMPPPLAPWSVISFWQHSETGRVPGVQGNCDLNLFNGPADRIALLGKPGSQTPEQPPTNYAVGPGILSAMMEQSDRPASNEHYLTPDWSEAYGESGNRYVYISSMNRVVVHAPTA